MLNPVTSPEYFKVNPKDENEVVKALFLSWESEKTPQIVTDAPDKIIATVFKEEKPLTLFFRNAYHIYCSPYEQYYQHRVNRVATGFVRHQFMITYGSLPPDTVYGNVLIFGTMNLRTRTVDNKDHSVPYYLVEEILRTYDIYR